MFSNGSVKLYLEWFLKDVTLLNGSVCVCVCVCVCLGVCVFVFVFVFVFQFAHSTVTSFTTVGPSLCKYIE